MPLFMILLFPSKIPPAQKFVFTSHLPFSCSGFRTSQIPLIYPFINTLWKFYILKFLIMKHYYHL